MLTGHAIIRKRDIFYYGLLYNVIIMDNTDESFTSPCSLDVLLKVLCQLEMS